MMHLNDSKQDWAARLTAMPGLERSLRMEGVQAVVNHPVLGKLPFILESPVDKYQEYGDEIRKVRKVWKAPMQR